MRYSTSLILLLWLVKAQGASTANISRAQQDVRSTIDGSLTNKSLASDRNVQERLVTNPAKETKLNRHPLNSDIETEEISANIEKIVEEFTNELLVPVTETELAIHLDIDFDAKETSPIVEKDQQRSTTKHPTRGTETLVANRPLVVGGDATQTSVILDTVHKISTTDLPIPVTETPHIHQGPAANATIEQQTWILKIWISTTEVPQAADPETTPLETNMGNSTLAVPSTVTPQKFTLGSAGDHNWTAASESVSTQGQWDQKVHENRSSQLTPTTSEEKEGGSLKRRTRSLALLMVPIVSFLARRAANTVSDIIGELVGGAATYVGFRSKLPSDANATTNATDRPVGG